MRVKDIVEAERYGDIGIEHHRRATLQFFRPSDGQVLCEEVVTVQGAGVVRYGESFGISVVAGRAINTEEGWVLFDLRYLVTFSQTSGKSTCQLILTYVLYQITHD